MRFIREREDRNKLREKFWELSGTKLGNLMKISKDVEKQENAMTPLQAKKSSKDDDVDYKSDSQYAFALKKKSEAVSDFSKSKTLKE